MHNHRSSVVLACAWYAAWTAPALAQTGATSGIAAQIETAAADSLYAVEITLTPAASIGELRAVAAELGIPRLFATVDYSIMLSLGSLFDGKAAGRHSECKTLLQLSSTQNSLRDVPSDEWPVSRMSVSATAHAVRELLRSTGSVATVVSGSPAPSDHLRTLERAVKSMASEPLANPNDIELPPYCAEFVVPLNEPYLTGALPRELQSLTAVTGESSRGLALRVLYALPPNTAVTLDLKFAPGMEIAALAALVPKYRISGLRAQLVPERSVQRMEAQVELSTFGELSAQVQGAQCAMRMTEERGHAAGPWRSDWVNISLGADDAASFLADESLAQATVSGAQPIAALARLAGYYERLTARTYEIPRGWPIPSGCEHIYRHGDYDDEGSVRGSGSSR